jgi:ankyrin repeat protein
MLHVNSLRGKVNATTIQDALAEIESGGSSFGAAYEKTMKMIESQDQGLSKLAKQALSWVALSSEPLTTDQLQHALAIVPGKVNLDFNNITKLEIILSTCAGLITIHEKPWSSSTVHLVHETTQIYFDKTQERGFGQIKPRLARLSLTYMTFQNFEAGPIANFGMSRYPLHSYLGQHLSEYIKGNDDDDARVRTLLEKLFLGDGYVAALLRLQRPHLSGATALHLAIFYCIGSVIPSLIRGRANARKADGQTGLHLAIEARFYDGIKRLLSAPEVNCNATGQMGRTALSHACEAGDEISVRLLLNCDSIDCNLADEEDIVPLSYALQYRRLAIAQLLLGREDVDYTHPDHNGITPFYWVIMSDSEACIKEILSKSCLDVNMVDNKGRTPLIWCIQRRNLQIALQLLSEEDLDLSLPTNTEPGPLIRAARWGQPDLMKVLLAKPRVDAFAQDNSYRTALDHAAECGNWQTFELLLEKYETTICIERAFENTALAHTLQKGPAKYTKLLINKTILDKDWWFIPALAVSMENHTLEGFEILEKTLFAWMQGHPEWMNACLIRAAEKGNSHVLASILQHVRHYAEGSEAEKIHFLHNRISWDDITIPEIVFDIHPTQFSVCDGLGQTVLHAKTRRRDIAAMRVLLHFGADACPKNIKGYTAYAYCLMGMLG